MDFFDDPNLFVGGLDGLDEDVFPTAPSFVDELNLSADFEPLQVEPLGKHQDMIPPVSSTSAQQAMPCYGQQMGHFIGIKAQNPMGQAFSGPGGTGGGGGGGGGIIAEQHGQCHSAAMTQVPQSNGLFFSSSSPMWGNQDQNGNMYHPLSQQQPPLCHQQQQQQQLHNQQLHVSQPQTQQHHACHQQQQRMRQQQLQQQRSHQQQLLNQHQQINTRTMSLPPQQHHNFPFQQGSQTLSQQQVHHSQQQVQLHPRVPRFHSRALPSKSYLDSQNDSLTGTCLQPQQQGRYQLNKGDQAFPGSGLGGNNLPVPMHHPPSMVHSLPPYISSATTYQPAQYPAYPGEPELPSQQSLSSASVARPITTVAPLASTLPELSGAVCQFPSTSVMGQQHARTPVNQAEECPFRAIRCSGETQGNGKSSEMFGESMSCYPSMARQPPSEQPQSCGAINTNGYQALGDNLLPSEAQDSDLEGLEPPDLLPDLLPQLEVALNHQDKSNGSWADSSKEWGHEHRRQPPVKHKEEKVTLYYKVFSFIFAL